MTILRGSVVAFALGFVVSAVPAGAQQLRLHIADGRVTLHATAVPVRQILSEWARVGGTKVVGGERITGAPLTLHIVEMPEREALDLVLRNVAGYMAAPRHAASAPGASSYDRILVMATSVNAAQAAATTPRPAGARGNAPANIANGRRMAPRPPNMPPPPPPDDTPDDVVFQDGTDTGMQPVFQFPQQNGNPIGNPFAPVQETAPGVFVPQPGNQPVIQLQPGQNGPTIFNFQPQQTTGTQTPGFTVVGSQSPGVVQQPPATPATTPTTQRRRQQ